MFSLFSFGGKFGGKEKIDCYIYPYKSMILMFCTKDPASTKCSNQGLSVMLVALVFIGFQANFTRWNVLQYAGLRIKFRVTDNKYPINLS